MNLNHTSLLPADFHPQSKLWIYQSDRSFGDDEAAMIRSMLEHFVSTWKSHGAPVKGYASLFYNQFIVLLADESATTVGGCSTDSSVHLIQAIQEKSGVDLFNRQNLAFLVNDQVSLIPLQELEKAVEDRIIDKDTLYFNNPILTKEELVNRWIIPVGQSWLANRIQIPEKAI